MEKLVKVVEEKEKVKLFGNSLENLMFF